MKTKSTSHSSVWTKCFLLGALALFSFHSAESASERKVKPYPKKTCVVSDNELGSMGKPISKVYQGQEVKFCCAPCVKKFDKDPEKYLKDL